jgi:hypothetical protein
MDGRPFIDDLAAAFASHLVYYPILFDERGVA